MARKTAAQKAMEATPVGRRHGKASIQIWLPIEVDNALESYASSMRPVASKTAVVTMLLEDFLRRNGKLK